MNELLRATWVIARRDFTAVVASRAFLLFLIVPLLFVGIFAGVALLDSGEASGKEVPVIGMQLSRVDADRLIAKRDELDSLADIGLPRLVEVHCHRPGCGDGDHRYQGILSGSIEHPVLKASRGDADRWSGRIALIIHAARQRDVAPASLMIHTIAAPPATSTVQGSVGTAQAGQGVIFLLTLLVAGMVISNLVEEKTSKIIEILAASISIDAIFLGKLLAMLAISLVAITLWGAAAAAVELLFGLPLPDIAQPALGWPLFVLLGVVYFTMAFMLLGTLLLGIGSLASTVREVQTLTMPVTMGQLLIFFLASYSMNWLGHPIELAAVIFPFSSPFAMLSRAAQQPTLLPHLLAIPWQILWVVIMIRMGSALFRRNVLKSGPGRKVSGG